MSSRPKVLPDDRYNQKLVSNVAPSDWKNPDPAPEYNLVVIGAGTAGLVASAGAAGLGAKVALVERHLLGGDCLNVGCVPSKALIRSSRAAYEMKHAENFGIETEVKVDFSNVMERMRKLRARISSHDSAKRFTDTGVDVFLGSARFTSGNTIDVEGKLLRFKKAVIATGARALRPPIEGLEQAGVLTNETVFNLTQKPERLGVIGGGPIGCELSQAFSRLGCNVQLFNKDPHLLPKEDEDAAAIIQQQFISEGIILNQSSTVEKIEIKNSEKIIHYTAGGEDKKAAVDEILMGAGRVPNVEDMGLEKAGVEFDTRHGVKVNDRLQTTNPNVYAAGDCCMKHKFTHAADFAARIVIQNALFLGRKNLSDLNIPWCTYTAPEIAHVGLYPEQAEEQEIEIDTFKKELSDVDRAIVDSEDEGFVKIHVKKGKDRIVGATMVATHAGDMISEISVAMCAGLGLGGISKIIHPYPTQAEAIRLTGDEYNRTRLTPLVKQMFSWWLELGLKK